MEEIDDYEKDQQIVISYEAYMSMKRYLENKVRIGDPVKIQISFAKRVMSAAMGRGMGPYYGIVTREITNADAWEVRDAYGKTWHVAKEHVSILTEDDL